MVQKIQVRIVPNVATNLADELIDRENRKFNLVIRNLPEGGNEADIIFLNLNAMLWIWKFRLSHW